MAERRIEVEIKQFTTGSWTCPECGEPNAESREPDLNELLNCADCGAQSQVTKKFMLRENYRG